MSLPFKVLKISLLTGLLSLAVAAPAAVSATTPPAVDHYVYLSFLPKPSELAQDAKANGLIIHRIDELSDRVIVSYEYPDGRTATLGYALLGTNGGAAARPAVAATTTVAASTARYVVSDRDPEVIYVSRPAPTQVYYYSEPWYNYWAPLTVGFGVGWATSYYGGHYYHGGGHYHGGYHGGGQHGGYHGGGGHGGGHSGGHGRR